MDRKQVKEAVAKWRASQRKDAYYLWQKCWVGYGTRWVLQGEFPNRYQAEKEIKLRAMQGRHTGHMKVSTLHPEVFIERHPAES